MRVDIKMGSEHEFNVNSWWTKNPDVVVNILQRQLEAASAIWPELKQYAVIKRASREARGVAGGHARAKSMSAEQRSEVASKAANARWSNGDQPKATSTT